MFQRKYEPTKIILPGQPHWQAIGQNRADAKALYEDAVEHGDVRPTSVVVYQHLNAPKE